MVINKQQAILLLICIIAVSAFFRLWGLSSIPPGVYPDEAINGNNALESLKNNDFKIFYPDNNGREGLYIWLLSLSFLIFGPSIWSLKFISAFFGISTVLGLYLLTKELFSVDPESENAKNKECLALLSSFFLAISFWHINFSRIAFRGILVPFLAVFSFYFLIKGFRTKKIANFIFSGIILGLGFYTYIAFRMIVFLLASAFGLWWIIYKNQDNQKQFFQFSILNLLSTFFTALPIGIYFLRKPADFFGRTTGVSIFAQPNPIKALFISFISHLGMFNFWGDGNWRHNLATSPQLLWPVGLLFLIGIFLIIKKLKKSTNNKSLFAPLFLFSWFFTMLLPGMLTYEGVPHALRSIGVIPIAYIFASVGFLYVYKKIDIKIKNKTTIITLCFLFFLILTSAQFNKYFNIWGTHQETKNGFSQNYVEIADYLNSLPIETQKIVIVNQSGVPIPWPDGTPVSAQTVMFLENIKYGETQSTYLLPTEINEIKTNNRPTVIIPMSPDEALFDNFKIMFPNGNVENKNSFSVYKIIN